MRLNLIDYCSNTCDVILIVFVVDLIGGRHGFESCGVEHKGGYTFMHAHIDYGAK